MAILLAIFGATGTQGSSVINFVLQDPVLSQKIKIRAITRDVNSKKAKRLAETVDVVYGDVLLLDTLGKALDGVHTVFAMTTPSLGPDAFNIEYNSAKSIADAAVEQHVHYIIFSTLPSVSKISSGKYNAVVPFDAKAEAEQYIRGLPTIKSAFFCPGSFMENFASQTYLAPRRAADGTWIMARNHSPRAMYPLIDATGDSGKFVGAMLTDPEKYEGKIVCAATALYSMEEICAIISRATGKKVIYKQISTEDFKESLPFMSDVFAEAFSFYGENGYYGPDTAELVKWAVSNVQGPLTTFEDFLRAHPLELE